MRREILTFERIRCHVIELIRIGRCMNELEAPAPQHHNRCNSAFGQVFANRFVVPIMGALGTAQMRDETLTVERIRPARQLFAARQFHQRGQQIEMRDRLAYPMRVELLRRMHDQRDPAAAFEESHLVPESALAKHLAVIRRHHDDGIFGKPRLFERFENRTELVVDVGNRAVISTPCMTDLLVGRWRAVGFAYMPQTLRMRIGFIERIAMRGQCDVFIRIQVPVFLRNRVRVVRMRQRSD